LSAFIVGPFSGRLTEPASKVLCPFSLDYFLSPDLSWPFMHLTLTPYAG